MTAPAQRSDAQRAASDAHEAAWVARDLCAVLVQALTPHGESFGPSLLDALGTVARLAEDHAERAKEAAWTASGVSTLPRAEGARP